MSSLQKFLCLALSFLALPLMAAEEAEEHDPLPQWSEEDAARVMRGECLISDALFRLQEEEAEPPPPPDVLELPEPGPESLNVVPPTEILDEDLAKYFGEISKLDEQVGALMKMLEDIQQSENTVVLFNGDNGGLPEIKPNTTGGLRGNKGTVFEGDRKSVV